MAITQMGRPVRRRVSSAYGTALVVTMQPEGLYVKEYGRRTSYLLPWGAAFVYAARLAADRRRAEKAAERNARKSAKRRR